MGNIEVFVLLLVAHVLGDFYLQDDKTARKKVVSRSVSCCDVCSWLPPAMFPITGAASWALRPYGIDLDSLLAA